MCKLKIVDVLTVFWGNIYFVVCLDCECEESGNFSHECLRTPFNLHVAGFELIIMSFGSRFNLESKNTKYRALYKQLADEARAAGIALGGYSLTSSRSAGMPADNVQNPKPRFGRGPCLCSRWGHDYLDALASFMDEAGFGVFENDGPSPGDSCSATNHPYHAGEADSVWR